MATIKFKGEPANTAGDLPQQGETLKDIKLVDSELNEKSLSNYKGKKLVLNIFPSIATGVCQKAMRSFHEKLSEKDDVVILNISKDLPFAAKQFCAAEGIENAVMLSDFRGDFGSTYGTTLVDSPFQGLLSRAVVVTDAEGKVVYTEQVSDIVNEPDYDAAIAAL